MIELPLTPSFFKKLGIYQEVTDKKLTENKHLWRLEKALLIWTVGHHHHFSSSISTDYVKDRLRELGFSQQECDSASKVMGNLCQRGYAIVVERRIVKNRDYEGPYVVYDKVTDIHTVAVDSPSEIVFTQEGLMAGRVLEEISSRNPLNRWKYKFFIISIWITLGILFVDVVVLKVLSWASVLTKIYPK